MWRREALLTHQGMAPQADAEWARREPLAEAALRSFPCVTALTFGHALSAEEANHYLRGLARQFEKKERG